MAGSAPEPGRAPGDSVNMQVGEVMEFEGTQDPDAEALDDEFRQGETHEVDFGSDEEPPESDDDMDDGEEIGVLNERDIYSEEEGEGVDDAVASMAHKQSVLSVVLSPTERSSMVTGGQDDVAVLWTLEEKQSGIKSVQRRRLEGHTDSVVEVAYSNDGKYIATGSYDGTVKIWDAEKGDLVHSLEGPSKEIEWILWHPKGHAILAGSNDTMAWMWWAPTGKLMQIFAGHAQGVACGCWGLGGKLIVTGSEDKSVIVWNPRAGTPQHHVKQLHESAVISICAHPDAPVVVTGSEDGLAKAVQIETGKVLATLSGHTDSVEAVGFSQAATSAGLLLLATASMDGKVKIWDGRTFDMRCELTGHVEHGGITKLKWLPAGYGGSFGMMLCTAGTDNTLRVFNALTAQCLHTFQGHSDTVLSLDVAIRDQLCTGARQQLVVASGADDNTCRIFILPLGVEAQGAGVVAGVDSGAVAVGTPSTSAAPDTLPV